MDTFELVHSAGLSKKEAAVYAALIEGGRQSMSGLHRVTQVSRPALYKILPILERKSLVSRVKQKNRYQYIAESPKVLLQQYEEKVSVETRGLSELAETFDKNDHERPVVKYFEGDRGVKFVFDDVINTLPFGGEFYRYSSRTGEVPKNFDKTLYAKNRDIRKIERLVITSKARAETKKPKLERSFRVIPESFDLFKDNVSLIIYGNKTAYVDYGSKTSFIIESEKIARFQQKIFKLLWKFLK